MFLFVESGPKPNNMKPTALFSSFFFLLSAFTTTTAEVLIDTDGDIVRNGWRYYLNPNSHVRGSGIIFSPIMHAHSCTLAVVDDPFNGGRETIISSPLRIAFLTTNIPLNLPFADLPPNNCADQSKWVVTRPSLPTGKPVIVGSAEEFGDAFVHGWFFIKRYKLIVSERHYYKLVFCEEENACKDVGVHVDKQNQRRLVVTDNEPLVFTIRKEWRRSSTSDLSMVV
ncbi:trypsin inhibitor 1A-like [Prosopis cineraria]|uniref:trypsin inhibitor 1A-like n=1 Tax=Prosopis cineraria TaxID=364024 RepID=UPI00240FDBC8|nr:trypsin inhibitor 1A-like [Prosopis cineraria]